MKGLIMAATAAIGFGIGIFFSQQHASADESRRITITSFCGDSDTFILENKSTQQSRLCGYKIISAINGTNFVAYIDNVHILSGHWDGHKSLLYLERSFEEGATLTPIKTKCGNSLPPPAVQKNCLK